ncbi:hypothetical protein JXB28_06465 [Candidatus Woesearchaeota archaeon]|nr:hypothetical protein [Candidatus Woesearchaeota archaeon]
MSEANVLGQRTRKTNIDTTLADKLNKEAEEEKSRKKPKEKQPKDESASSPLEAPAPSPSGLEKEVLYYEVYEPPAEEKPKTQDGWISFYNDNTHGLAMMSSSDFYAIANQLKREFELGTKEEKKQAGKVIERLRKDMKKGIVFSTRLQFNGLEAKITHHFGAKDWSSVKEIVVQVPEYDERSLTDVLSQAGGLQYLQAYFDTIDDVESIISNLQFITGKAKRKLVVTSPDLDSRHKYNEMAAHAKYKKQDYGYFFVSSFNIGSNLKTGESSGSRAVRPVRRREYDEDSLFNKLFPSRIVRRYVKRGPKYVRM